MGNLQDIGPDVRSASENFVFNFSFNITGQQKGSLVKLQSKCKGIVVLGSWTDRCVWHRIQEFEPASRKQSYFSLMKILEDDVFAKRGFQKFDVFRNHGVVANPKLTHLKIVQHSPETGHVIMMSMS